MIVSLMRNGAKQPVLGNVSPDRSGHPIVVKVYKRHSGSWVLKRSKRGVIGQGRTVPAKNWFFVQVKGINSGTCKVVAKYPGDAKYKASHSKAIVKCATGVAPQ